MVMSQCAKCSKCCRNVSIEVDEPSDDKEIDEYVWIIMHENIRLYIEEDKWYLEILTPCKMLEDDRQCSIYADRPEVCREYETENCLKNGDEDYFDVLFTNPGELKAYWKEHYEDIEEDENPSPGV